jgi:ABC-type uncharacterized transport system auxiliary subunit
MHRRPTPTETPEAVPAPRTTASDWCAPALAAINAGCDALRAARYALPADDPADPIGRVAHVRRVLTEALRHLESARNAIAPRCRVARWALNEC